MLLATVPRGRGAGMARVGGGIAGWKRRTGLRIESLRSGKDVSQVAISEERHQCDGMGGRRAKEAIVLAGNILRQL